MTHIFASAAASVLRRAGVPTRSGSAHPTGAAVLRGSLEEGTFEHRFWRTYQKGETDRLHQAAVDLARIRRHELRADRRQAKASAIGSAPPSMLPPQLSQSATAIFKLLCELGRLCKGEIYPTYDWFIEKTGFARATVARAIAQLKDAGFLLIQRRCKRVERDGPGPRYKQTSNAYRLEWPVGLDRWLNAQRTPCPLPDDEMVRLQVEEDNHRTMQLSKPPRKSTEELALFDTLARMARTIEERESQKDTQPLKSESDSLTYKGNWPGRPINST
ncbi:helix-turn-helix domain-containing protein [Sphingopyxis granuli]|uniref:helix-turn-helix domain-containing protein n=1 Tax=Sphingopyxis granuli TaxID=267128 RepID=UPI001BAFA62C|nr:helix-turn-helix domain-containing protein [Sphingopyxis granuli]QUM74588.1 helix-turn-helix domain-containing protein [Sphingopyxis granuli]